MQEVKKAELLPHDVRLLAKKGYTMGDALASGSFACVCKATFNGRPAACKVIDLEKTTDDYRLKFLPRELYTMKKLHHPFVIEVLDIFVVGNRVLVFMEFADGGDMIDLLQKSKSALTEEKVRFYYRQFGDALRYMHKSGFAHRDIKCENILMNHDRTVAKLTDFGFTRSCIEHGTGQKMLSDTYCGSASYLAPEVVKGEPYNPLIRQVTGVMKECAIPTLSSLLTSDVWSMGIVMYVLLHNRKPFAESDRKKLLARQMAQDIKFTKPKLSADCKELIKCQLIPEPDKRYTMEMVLAHKWFGDAAIPPPEQAPLPISAAPVAAAAETPVKVLEEAAKQPEEAVTPAAVPAPVEEPKTEEPKKEEGEAA
ncbi:Kinase-like [Tyrophagus putrescentiae]|nr:Kinase-like [Tyrophagus putrescentiae]